MAREECGRLPLTFYMIKPVNNWYIKCKKWKLQDFQDSVWKCFTICDFSLVLCSSRSTQNWVSKLKLILKGQGHDFGQS